MTVVDDRLTEIERELEVTRKRLADLEEWVRKIKAAIGTMGTVVE